MEIRPLIKSLYGSVSLLKAYCVHCKAYSFISDGNFICCGEEYKNIRDADIVIRESNPSFTRNHGRLKIKQKILQEQGYRCIYCGCSFKFDVKRPLKSKINFDHFIPFGGSGNDLTSNLVATCRQCNLTKSTKIFKDITQAREYILKQRNKKIGRSKGMGNDG